MILHIFMSFKVYVEVLETVSKKSEKVLSKLDFHFFSPLYIPIS